MRNLMGMKKRKMIIGRAMLAIVVIVVIAFSDVINAITAKGEVI